MRVGCADYQASRDALIEKPEAILSKEESYTSQLLLALSDRFSQIEDDFNYTNELYDFWIRYAPKQRGHKPRGDSLPWGEVGEKVIEGHLFSLISKAFGDVRFIGLPYGHDVRFVTDDAFVHIDIKSTGPNDNPNEVVASPNQVSGDGKHCDAEGVANSPVEVVGPRGKPMTFQPELPPFYTVESSNLITLTFYLKCVYYVVSPGHQPLSHLELISVPNGLVMFDTLNFNSSEKGLMMPGKDEKHFKHKRTRIKLDPLALINSWRCQKIFRTEGGKVQTEERGSK